MKCELKLCIMRCNTEIIMGHGSTPMTHDPCDPSTFSDPFYPFPALCRINTLHCHTRTGRCIKKENERFL